MKSDQVGQVGHGISPALRIYIQVQNPARQWLLKHLIKTSTCNPLYYILYPSTFIISSWVEESTHIERFNLFLDIFSIKVTRVPQTSPKSSNGQSQTAKSGPAFKFVEVSCDFIMFLLFHTSFMVVIHLMWPLIHMSQTLKPLGPHQTFPK